MVEARLSVVTTVHTIEMKVLFQPKQNANTAEKRFSQSQSVHAVCMPRHKQWIPTVIAKTTKTFHGYFSVFLAEIKPFSFSFISIVRTA